MATTHDERSGVTKSPPSPPSHNIFHHHHRHGTAAGDAGSSIDSTASQDPLVAFEHHLLAHPGGMPRLSARSLTVPSLHYGRHPSPSPSPDARRCMAATEAWTPSLDRRQSWDGQAYRRAMMVKATGILCGTAEANGPANNHEETAHLMGHPHCLGGHQHHNPFLHAHEDNGSCNSYEDDRGFSECADGAA